MRKRLEKLYDSGAFRGLTFAKLSSALEIFTRNIQMNTHLRSIEESSIYLIREAYAQRKNLGMLWSMGKDSTVLLHLTRKAFLGHCPIPLIHIDTTYKIPEMIRWRDEYVRRHNLKLIVGKNTDALDGGMGPEMGRLTCCGALKTQALLNTLKQHEIQTILVGVRRDEEGSRGKERFVSPRNDEMTWNYTSQPAEIWHYFNFHLPENISYRVHPLLQWTEMDIWEYIKAENIDIMPLYFANNGKRYRSLGCAPCTGQIESSASSVDEIIAELQVRKETERAGRAQDQAGSYAMQKLRSAGYM